MRKEFRKTRRIKKKESILKSKFFWLGVGIIALAELFFYIIVLSPFLQIREVRVEGNVGVSEGEIQGIVLQDLWGRFFFFPTSSILLADTQGMRDDLLNTLVELETVSIHRRFPNILSVSVQEKRTVALWCEESGCFELDKNGTAFKRTDPSPDFPIIDSMGEVSGNLGEAIVANNTLSVILDFSKEIKRRFMLGNEASINSFGIISENQIEASISEGWSIYFTKTQDLSWQIAKLQAVLENKVSPEKRRRLEYIDVRFGDQAYIKYR